MKRHPFIATMRPHTFDDKRNTWAMYTNFKLFYKNIYEEAIANGTAEKFDVPVLMDRDNNSVHAEEEAFGNKVEYSLLYHDRLLFMDETGNNTNEKKDGHRNKNVLGVKGEHATIPSPTTDVA